MPAFALALALAFAQPAPAEGSPAPAPAAEPSWPAGAPHDDYQLVAWCYGALRGYLDLHDQVMPEVTRIESEFRRPGSKLEDDLKVYAEAQAQGRKDLKAFQAALTAAEKASLRPINQVGAAAVARGHGIWIAPPNTPKARIAQEWMSWTLPARCETTAANLQKRAVLMGPAFKVNEDEAPETAPAQAAPDPAPTAEPPPAESPK